MWARRCIVTASRLHHVKIHNNAPGQSNLEQNTATQIPYSLVGRVPLAPQSMKQLESGDIGPMQSKVKGNVNFTALVLHRDTFTCERILTNDPTRHERTNLTLYEVLADLKELKQHKETSKEEFQTLKAKFQKVENDKRRRHAGEVVNMRDRLARLVLSAKEDKQRKLQVRDPKDMKDTKHDRNRFAHEIDLDTTLEQMALYNQFDICSITVFGETQNNIKELLTWDKDGECEVYNIFNEHGAAWHHQFANTCIEPFNKWLSAIYALKEIESAMLENPSSYFEARIQKQKDGIKEAIREWKETFMTDNSKRGKRTRKCRELIRKDYTDRGLKDQIRAALLRGVTLVEGSGESENIEENRKNEESKNNEESKENQEGRSKKTKKDEG
ncbi:uncharacterized protein EAE97_003960 [Botrytis byssoidea]|uniref:Uncharacterized protein n=1 Tax=Botrytis byssoidea TaxID=139641 RepID=A0A9P5IU44_9HELO|nr:uncharacterized protein EAE97_003960 [Botrytis byssoidea]KAF7948549.1 hypothetical protein EAE97_003960 [Botrytis byssoidea]